MTYRPSIAERIALTSGQLSAAEVKVLVALWSCGDFETGRNCRPYVRTIVERSRLSRATVTRTLARLRDPDQPGGPWIVPTFQHHRQATRYDIRIDRLAKSPAKEQQMSISAVQGQPNLEAHFEPQEILEAHFEPQEAVLEAHFEPPTPDQDLVPKYVHTVPRAREERSDRIHRRDADNELAEQPGDLPIIGAVPRRRCNHPHAHAWCEGRVHVPKGLHFEFLDRLDTRPGESGAAKAGRLVAFYAAACAALPADQPIGEEPYKFWRTRFAEAFASPPAPRHAPRLPVYAAPSADERARREALDAAETLELEAATRAYAELPAAARAELDRQAREELKGYRLRMTADNFATTVQHCAIKLLRHELRRQPIDQRKNG